MKGLLFSSATVLIALNVFAGGAIKTNCGFHPNGHHPNRMTFLDSSNGRTSGITKERYLQLLSKVYEEFKSDFAQRGFQFSAIDTWEDKNFNAYAMATCAEQLEGFKTGQQIECRGRRDIRLFTVTGGLARASLVTEDGFLLAACHEIGHHIAGAPLRADVMSNEGQSDYFAAMKCARRIFSKEDNVLEMQKRIVPGHITRECETSFSTPQDIALCQRVSMGAWSITRLLTAAPPATISFTTPDPTVVETTFMSHPQAQCRFDTYFAGAVCTADMNRDFDMTNPNVGACTRQAGDKRGVRPLCWYKPGEVAAAPQRPSFIVLPLKEALGSAQAKFTHL